VEVLVNEFPRLETEHLVAYVADNSPLGIHRLADVEIGVTQQWDLCLVVKEYLGRADVLREVRRYRAGERGAHAV